ncbi:hypothetical protein RS130_12170 [Paraglaciecola aquimarina]|uniref:Uncharacterized protein n=1 Tax=Paraglaciecola aquimarina TaxID=1235557 RepID=A0ABU3SX35_9ALTE|nr:hypothetical protein [Paraglaciecola aquimarina]MDU0354577.1 hypothetical protein [Paraglaciecola aquimarina]
MTDLDANTVETSYTQVFVNNSFKQMARFPDNVTGKMLDPLNTQSGYALIINANKPQGKNARATVEFTSEGDVAEIPDVTFTDEAVVRGLIGKLRNNIFSAATDGAAIQRESARKLSFIGTNNGPWTSDGSYSLPEGFGYIFDLAVLDREGEWFLKRIITRCIINQMVELWTAKWLKRKRENGVFESITQIISPLKIFT